MQMRVSILAMLAVATAASSAAAQEWKTYGNAQDGLSVELPGAATMKDDPPKSNLLLERNYELKSGASGGYMVMAIIRNPAADFTAAGAQAMQIMADQFKKDCQVHNERWLSVPGGVGSEFTFEKCPESAAVRLRSYTIGHRIYNVIAVGPAGFEKTAEAQRVFDFFKLTEMAPPPAPVAAPAKPLEWQTFASAEDGFSIEFPGVAQPVPANLNAQTMISNRQYAVPTGNAVWLAAATRYHNPARGNLSDDAFANGMIAAIKDKCELRDDRRTSIPDGLVMDLTFDKCPDIPIKKLRITAVGRQLYQQVVLGPAGIEASPDTQRFFNSFKLLAPPPAAAEAPPARTAAAPPAAAPAAQLTGLAAWNALVGNTITGKNDDGLLTEYYLPDGSVKSKTDDESSVGRWSVRGERVCFKFPKEDEECYRLQVQGNVATYTGSDGKPWRYEVLKGNPKRL